MNILVIGGTRFFGIHMVNELLTAGHDVTIATRGKASDSFGDKVKRIFLERTKEESVREALSGTHYDVVIDKIAYCSNDIKYVAYFLPRNLMKSTIINLIHFFDYLNIIIQQLIYPIFQFCKLIT